MQGWRRLTMVITISCLGNKELYCSGPRILAPNDRSVKKSTFPNIWTDN